MNIEADQLKKFLLDAGLVAQEDFEAALEASGKNGQGVEDVLVDQGLVERKKITKFKAYVSGIPFADLEEETILPDVLRIIPEQLARAHNIVAFRKTGNTLEVAMIDPEDLTIVDFLRKTDPSLKISTRLATPEAIKNVLKQYQRNFDLELGEMTQPLPRSLGRMNGKDIEASENLRKAAEELPIIEIVDSLLRRAIFEKASDIHIEPLEKEVLVRFRVDGILHDIVNLPIQSASAVVARIKVISNLKLDEHRLPQDGRFKIETADYKYSVRVSILPVSNGEKIVMRLLQEDVKGQTLESLGFEGLALKKVQENLTRPVGMILITGPTGSGKTTTLYTMMDILNTPQVNISTIEDPIEYRMPRINQTQVNSTIGLTFASGLRSLVRQDPNIIMIGEVRDKETASLAVNAALTGHMVLSTLHTTDASGAIPRLIDMDVEPFLIASTVNLIIAQRLVRKLVGPTENHKLTSAEVENLSKYCDMEKVLQILREEKLLKQKETLEDVEIRRPKTSKSGSGYKGRIGIFEFLFVTEEIRGLIIQKASNKDIANLARKEGMRTMVEDGLVKVVKGITSIEEVLRVIIE